MCISVRLAAFRLIEASVERKPGIDCECQCFRPPVTIPTLPAPFWLALIRVLQIASKAGASLAG